MPMIELKIKWDGQLDSLNQKRLSVGLFAAPLQKLLAAVRRTASNILREGSNRKETATGRFASEADQIDIQIVDLLRQSTGIQSIISVQAPQVPQMAMFNEKLAEDSMDRVLLEIERESRGIRRSDRVREYLEALPSGLTHQDYWLYVDGNLVRDVHIGPLALPTGLDAVPYLVEITGKVIGVGFPPGTNTVRIKDNDGSEISLASNNENVLRALEIRDGDVRVLAIVRDSNKRLLRIQSLHEARVRLDENVIFEQWRTLLGRLAQ